MNNKSEHLWKNLDKIYEKWNLKEIPFVENIAEKDIEWLSKIFTGRDKELSEAFNLFRARQARRVLITGGYGIGKTAFILEVLRVIRKMDKKSVTAYIRLSANTDLATAAFIALARELPNIDWAQRQLNEMGLRPDKALRDRVSTAGANVIVKGEVTEHTVPPKPITNITFAFEDLLEEAYQKYEKVIIAIDDLDKQDPAKVRELLLNAQGLLKGGAYFMLTAHPYGLAREEKLMALGIVDFCIKLKPFDNDTIYKILVKCLNTARMDNKEYQIDDPKAIHPFTKETANILCQKSSGIPRWLNRNGNCVLIKANELKKEIIDMDTLQAGLKFVDLSLRGQSGITAEHSLILNIILEKGILSDDISFDDLQKLGVNSFMEIIPLLEDLINKDLLRVLPQDTTTAYIPNPILEKHKDEDEKNTIE